MYTYIYIYIYTYPYTYTYDTTLLPPMSPNSHPVVVFTSQLITTTPTPNLCCPCRHITWVSPEGCPPDTAPHALVILHQRCSCRIQSFVLICLLLQVICDQHGNIIMQLFEVFPRVVVSLKAMPTYLKLHCTLIGQSPSLKTLHIKFLTIIYRGACQNLCHGEGLVCKTLHS